MLYMDNKEPSLITAIEVCMSVGILAAMKNKSMSKCNQS